ncbi:ABC transporter permease [Candidatus Bipolaricaulota bacterium]|nr:ABC transporter permease [Candidatus Bipolaricaulota bacterium]
MKVALRYLVRNRRRTLLTLLAVLIPVYFLVFMFGFANANLRDMFETATRFDTGHAQIRAVPTKATGAAIPLMRDPSDALAALAEVKGIEWRTVRLDLPALASVGDRSRAVHVQGVVPEEIGPVSALADRIIAGSSLTAGEGGVLVGEELAHLLGVEVGDEVVLLGAHPETALGAIREPVIGVYRAPEATLGRTVVYADLATARQLARSEVAATAIVIRVAGVASPRDQTTLNRVVRELRAALPAGYEVKDWTELVPMVATYMGILTPALAIVAGIFFALGGLVVLNTIYLSVLERTRELGLILSLGASRGRVVKMILAEAGVLAVVGALGGALTGVALILVVEAFGGIPLWGAAAEFMREMGMSSVLHLSADPGQVALAAGAMAAVAVLAAWWPARRASRLEPMEAMRYVD